jgi:hypothetical protein
MLQSAEAGQYISEWAASSRPASRPTRSPCPR